LILIIQLVDECLLELLDGQTIFEFDGVLRAQMKSLLVD
jgi:hypothetical protein